MKNIQKFKIFPLVCILFVNLSACNESKTQNLPQDVVIQTQHNSQKVDEVHESTPGDLNISTTLSSGVEVISGVNISNNVNIEQIAVYDAEIVKLDYELLKQLFLNNKEIIEEASKEMAEARTDALYHYCITDDGSSLTYTGEGFTYEDGLYALMQNILFKNIIDLDQFVDNGDLSFLTREEAQQEIEKVLNQLKLEVEETPICYTLAFDDLQLICDKLNSDRKTAVGEGSPLYTPLSCDEADARYIFIYQISTKGLPISTHSNGVFGDGSWTSGTSLYCFYSAEGVVGMELPYSLKLTGQAPTTTNGLSITQLLEKIDDKFNSMILSGSYLANKIEFEYVPMPVSGSRNLFKLIPGWRVSILHTYQYQDPKSAGETFSAEEQFDVVFNAITGEELVNSSGSA